MLTTRRKVSALVVALVVISGGSGAAWAQVKLLPPPDAKRPGADASGPAAEQKTDSLPAPRVSEVFLESSLPLTLPPVAPTTDGPTPPTKQIERHAEKQATTQVAAQEAVQPVQPVPPPPGAIFPGGEGQVQDAPGAFGRYSPIFPDYFYDPNYYNTSGIGARPLADYAPPGYEARDVSEGQAPGVPEFSPIPVPTSITPEQRRTFVSRGIMPGSFLVPYTNTSFRIRGFVRLTGLLDFDPIGSRDDFVTNTIPVPQESGQNLNMSARYSRFAIETWTPTPFLDWNVHTFIEADFFNGPAQAVGGGGNPFRLRHAFVDFGYFRIGQQNTVFMDGNAFPQTVDFAGPRGLVNQRRPGLRMTIPVCDRLYWATGVEQPFSDITTFGQGDRVQDVPDFATHLRYEADAGHLQLSMLGRAIGYRPDGGELVRRGGWGFSTSAVFHPWAIFMGTNPTRNDNPTGLERSRILLQHTFGWGIGRYIQDTAGLGIDGQVDPATGGFDTVYACGWSATYEHWFTERWLANVTYSEDFVASNGAQPGDTYAGAKYLTTALWWIPVPRMSLGIEYVWGERENLDEERGRADRLNALFQYNF